MGRINHGTTGATSLNSTFSRLGSSDIRGHGPGFPGRGQVVPEDRVPRPNALTNDVVCPNCGLTLLKLTPKVDIVPSEGTIFMCGSCGKSIDLSPSKQ